MANTDSYHVLKIHFKYLNRFKLQLTSSITYLGLTSGRYKWIFNFVVKKFYLGGMKLCTVKGESFSSPTNQDWEGKATLISFP